MHIQVEEQNQNRDKVKKAKELSSKGNMVEEKPRPKKLQVQKEKLQDQAQYNKQGSKFNYKKEG